jgi:hypothetical protein
MTRLTTHTRPARNVVAAERERTVAERRAFEAFAHRVQDLPTNCPSFKGSESETATRPLSGVDRSPSSTVSDRVRGAYRETVLALPHYDEEYGETAMANLTAEFGTGIGNALAGTTVLTPDLQAGLYRGAREAAGRRRRFASVLEGEREALDDAVEELGAIGTTLAEATPGPTASFPALSGAHEHLRALESRCESLAMDRQELLHGSRRSGRRHCERDDRSLNEYLYDALEVEFPVLADASDAIAVLWRERRRLERALAHSV